MTSEPTINGDKVDHGDGTGSLTVTFSVTSPGVFYARAFATTPTGTTYSDAMEFGVVYDADNNRYNLVRIGNRIWMRENLKSTHFSNGDVIPKIPSTPGTESSWSAAVATAYSEVPAGKPSEFGNYYNGYVVLDARNVCPTGWHVPNQSDVDDLQATIGSSGSSSLERFAEVITGWRDKNGSFGGYSTATRLWTTVSTPGNNKAIQMVNSSQGVLVELYDVKYGFSIRCVKD